MTLVRALVRRKSYVAIDAHHTFLRGTHMGGSKVSHGAVHGFDERQHRLFQLTLELGFVGLEPLPAVITLQAAQKFEPSLTKVRFAVKVCKGRDHHENGSC